MNQKIEQPLHAIKLEKTYDLERIRSYFKSIHGKGLWEQVSLTYRPGHEPYTDGCGKSYDLQTKTRNFFESDFSETVDGVENPIFDILQSVRQHAQNELGLKMGRIRFMTLKPKTCLSYHTDEDQYRYHIPVFTNENSFFIVDKIVYQMTEPGRLYKLQVNLPHTAINADLEHERTHLVFDTAPGSSRFLSESKKS